MLERSKYLLPVFQKFIVHYIVYYSNSKVTFKNTILWIQRILIQVLFSMYGLSNSEFLYFSFFCSFRRVSQHALVFWLVTSIRGTVSTIAHEILKLIARIRLVPSDGKYITRNFKIKGWSEATTNTIGQHSLSQQDVLVSPKPRKFNPL